MAKNSRLSVTDEDRQLYPTLNAAQANRPEGKENWWLFQITDPAGEHRWSWGPYAERVLWHACEEDGWVVIAVEDVPSKVEVGAMLAALSPEDRAALLTQFVPAGSPTPNKKGK
jgi:hypothetical protein